MTFWGLLRPDGISSGAKFTLRPSLAFSYTASITAWHCSSAREPNFAAWYTEWNYGTFADGTTYIQLGGHHVGHRPTFQLVMQYCTKLYANSVPCGCQPTGNQLT